MFLLKKYTKLHFFVLCYKYNLCHVTSINRKKSYKFILFFQKIPKIYFINIGKFLKNKKNFNILEGKNILTTKKQESKILVKIIRNFIRIYFRKVK